MFSASPHGETNSATTTTTTTTTFGDFDQQQQQRFTFAEPHTVGRRVAVPPHLHPVDVLLGGPTTYMPGYLSTTPTACSGVVVSTESPSGGFMRMSQQHTGCYHDDAYSTPHGNGSTGLPTPHHHYPQQELATTPLFRLATSHSQHQYSTEQHDMMFASSTTPICAADVSTATIPPCSSITDLAAIAATTPIQSLMGIDHNTFVPSLASYTHALYSNHNNRRGSDFACSNTVDPVFHFADEEPPLPISLPAASTSAAVSAAAGVYSPVPYYMAGGDDFGVSPPPKGTTAPPTPSKPRRSLSRLATPQPQHRTLTPSHHHSSWSPASRMPPSLLEANTNPFSQVRGTLGEMAMTELHLDGSVTGVSGAGGMPPSMEELNAPASPSCGPVQGHTTQADWSVDPETGTEIHHELPRGVTSPPSACASSPGTSTFSFVGQGPIARTGRTPGGKHVLDHAVIALLNQANPPTRTTPFPSPTSIGSCTFPNFATSSFDCTPQTAHHRPNGSRLAEPASQTPRRASSDGQPQSAVRFEEGEVCSQQGEPISTQTNVVAHRHMRTESEPMDFTPGQLPTSCSGGGAYSGKTVGGSSDRRTQRVVDDPCHNEEGQYLDFFAADDTTTFPSPPPPPAHRSGGQSKTVSPSRARNLNETMHQMNLESSPFPRPQPPNFGANEEDEQDDPAGPLFVTYNSVDVSNTSFDSLAPLFPSPHADTHNPTFLNHKHQQHLQYHEVEPGDRFRGARFRFHHRVPNSQELEYVPLHLDVNGIVWMAVHYLNGLPYAVKEVPVADHPEHSGSSAVAVELTCLTIGNDVSTLTGLRASEHIVRYFSTYFDKEKSTHVIQTEYFPRGNFGEAMEHRWRSCVADAAASVQRNNIREDTDVADGVRKATVERRLRRWFVGEVFPPALELTVMMQHVLIALNSLHHHGIVHGNPIPWNVFISTNHHYKLGSFGAAAVVVAATQQHQQQQLQASPGWYPTIACHERYLPRKEFRQHYTPFQLDVHVFAASLLDFILQQAQRIEDIFIALMYQRSFSVEAWIEGEAHCISPKTVPSTFVWSRELFEELGPRGRKLHPYGDDVFRIFEAMLTGESIASLLGPHGLLPAPPPFVFHLQNAYDKELMELKTKIQILTDRKASLLRKSKRDCDHAHQQPTSSSLLPPRQDVHNGSRDSDDGMGGGGGGGMLSSAQGSSSGDLKMQQDTAVFIREDSGDIQQPVKARRLELVASSCPSSLENTPQASPQLRPAASLHYLSASSRRSPKPQTHLIDVGAGFGCSGAVCLPPAVIPRAVLPSTPSPTSGTSLAMAVAKLAAGSLRPPSLGDSATSSSSSTPRPSAFALPSSVGVASSMQPTTSQMSAALRLPPNRRLPTTHDVLGSGDVTSAESSRPMSSRPHLLHPGHTRVSSYGVEDYHSGSLVDTTTTVDVGYASHNPHSRPAPLVGRRLQTSAAMHNLSGGDSDGGLVTPPLASEGGVVSYQFHHREREENANSDQSCDNHHHHHQPTHTTVMMSMSVRVMKRLLGEDAPSFHNDKPITSLE